VTQRLAFVALAAAALAGCGGGGGGDTSSAPKPVTISIRIEGGKPVGGIHRATATRGGRVTFVVHSEVADEVHVHGYDLHQDVESGGTARIAFNANIAGAFEVELEARKLQIAELTVK
jgi:hypothetical protein